MPACSIDLPFQMPGRSSNRRATWCRIFLLVPLVLSRWVHGEDPAELTINVPLPASAQEFGQPSGLPLPSRLSIAAYEAQLFEFLNSRRYEELGWRGDKGIRDTGPYLRDRYYGTHPAVRVFYSPEILQWLVEGRKGTIPDGAMIIKEQYDKPAIKHSGKNKEELWNALNAWTIMVKDAAGSYDGWYWSNPQKNAVPVNNHKYPYDYPISGFGHYCLRCHASTQSPGEVNEFSFIALRNIAGFPGEPLLFRVDDSWRTPPRPENLSNETLVSANVDSSHPRCGGGVHPSQCEVRLNQTFLKTFSSIPTMKRQNIQVLPGESHDWAIRVPRDRIHQQGFVTSNQCQSCHSGLTGDFGPSMFAYTSEIEDYGKPGFDYSPYGEWRWTPMGLAGRDPIFFAQLETQLAMLRREFKHDPAKVRQISGELANLCLRCHGAMGHREFHAEHAGSNDLFSLEHVMTPGGQEPTASADARYGALARDGISCAVCHRMQPLPQPANDKRPELQHFLATSITGNTHMGPPNELYGPFKDDELSPYAMEHALGYTPKHSPYIQSSRMCGTCHTVNLPMIDQPLTEEEQRQPEVQELLEPETVAIFRKFHHHIEQATYLEWLNSEYENEYEPDNARAQSCQDCHMSRDLHVPERNLALDVLETRIAAIQDSSYPEAENLASHEKLNVRYRESGYRRHNFSGLNVFLVEMFNQFDDILGVRKVDFMTGNEQLWQAVSNFQQTAQHKVADLKVTTRFTNDKTLEATVKVTNKVGHRFPSGVGFRRAFLELLVLRTDHDGHEEVIWGSGRTNSAGVLVDEHGQQLPTEFHESDSATGEPQYQRHHQRITRQDQVQIYETLLRNMSGELTTSFIHGSDAVKDNRLLPRGWKRKPSNPALVGEFLKATFPGRDAIEDPLYTDGSGTDELVYVVPIPKSDERDRFRVRVTMYYQSIPPNFLRTIFENSPDGPAAQRLHYMCSNLNLEGTPIADWKLKIVSEETQVSR